jgi:hypothetical protein
VSTAPYVTLLGFTRYVGRTGPGKATYVGGLRRQHEARSGFNPHGSLIKALKADIQFRTGGTHLDEVTETVNPRWRPLYQALTAGARTYLHTLGEPPTVQVTRARDALGVLCGLTIKINPHFGLRAEDGTAQVVRLHFDEEPPRPEAATAALYLMARHIDQVLPHATPVLVDVRRGEVIRADPSVKPDEVERWLTGEAAAFSAMWGTAA